jgi:hypothetical protein
MGVGVTHLMAALVGCLFGLLSWASTSRRACAALEDARSAQVPLEPDGWAGDRPYLSAEMIERTATAELARVGISVDFVGNEITQVGATTVDRVRFRWRWSSWRSPVTTIEVLLDPEIPMGGRATASLTSARKVYLRALLGIRQSVDPESIVNRSADAARQSVRASTAKLLRAYAKKKRRQESAIIRMAVGSRANQHEPPSFDSLLPLEVAALYWWLVSKVETPEEFVQGEMPSGSPALEDDLPWAAGGGA